MASWAAPAPDPVVARHDGFLQRERLDPEPTTERAGGIVRCRAVVIRENSVVAAIAKERAAEFSDS